MESRLPPEKARERRKELIATFARIADYAAREQVTAVLLCGDIFDEGKPRFGDKKNFIDIVRSHPSVDFLCLSGNHDESLADEPDLPENLLCFDETWHKYSYGDTDIWGIEQTDANCALYYSTLHADPQRFNIVMLHGQTLPSGGKPERDAVVLPYLRGKSIDYLALGHIHSLKEGVLDERGVWCYCGCPEGRGFDECGEKGFVLLDVGNDGFSRRFIPFARRTIVERHIDLSGLSGSYEIERKILSELRDISPENMVRVYLEGACAESADYSVSGLEKVLGAHWYAASVKDCTKPAVDYSAYENELSLRGEFTRLVMNADGLEEEDKLEILRCGIAALAGEEVRFR